MQLGLNAILLRAINRFWPGEGTCPHANLGPVGFMRYVQNTRESGLRQNPDCLVKHFLKPIERIKAKLGDIRSYRNSPYYHHLLARTKFYDKIFIDAIRNDCKQIVIVGVGTDTRTFRFRQELDESNTRVIENDLPTWIGRRRELSNHLKKPSQFVQVGMDLEGLDFRQWEADCNFNRHLKTQFIVEGVSPYISTDSFKTFLNNFSRNTPPGSCIAYDFIIERENDPMNVTGDRFRMAADKSRISDFHAELNLETSKAFLGIELQDEFLDYPYESAGYSNDGFLIASVR